MSETVTKKSKERHIVPKDQRKRGNWDLLATILLILLVVAGLVSAFIGCNRVVYTRAHNQIDDAVNTVIDQVRAKFLSDGEFLNSVAEVLSGSDAFDKELVDLSVTDPQEKEQELEQFRTLIREDLDFIRPIQKLLNLRIYLPSCDVFLPEEDMSSFTISEAEYLGTKQALDRDRSKPDSQYGMFVSSRFESRREGYDGEQIVGQYVPVVRDDEVVAVLCGVTRLRDFPRLLRVSNIYNGSAEVAIIDVKSEGYEVIMDTSKEDADGNVLPLGEFTDYTYKKIDGWDSVDEFRADLVKGNSDDVNLWSDERNEWMYSRYAPVGGSTDRWSVIVSVPSSVAFKNVNTVRNIFIIVGSVLACALVAYFFWIRKSVKDAIAKSVERAVLEEKLYKAEAAERAKTVFLSNMSHDIRTPMNAILGFTALAEANINDKDRVQDYLRKILSSGNHLLSLINDILDMSRIESGKLNIEEKPCSISEIFRDMRNIIQTQMKSKQLNFFMDTLDVIDEDIYCDKLHVNQVLLNLLSNAIKFTPPGGSVSLTVRQKAGAPTGYGAYEIRVKDTGIGMSPEFVKHIFEPFERERTSTVSGIQGTGLGMAITKNIVDTMGGTIRVETEQGHGTEFILELTFRLQAERKQVEVIRELEGLRALVVDDNFETCASVSKMLMQIGMRSEWTMYGKEAVLRAQQAVDVGDSFSAYIIDWVMPDLSGFEIVRQIRKIVGSEVPIIIITAYDVTAIMDEAKDIGVTAYCNKPIFLSELRSTLVSAIGPEGNTAAEGVIPAPNDCFRGKRILLVEDNELNREIAEELLLESGFEVEMAENGAIAVEKVKAASHGYYDLVLMDVQMPVMDGYAATRAIRALDDKELASVPIVAMTANAFDEDRHMAAESGMNAHVAKPIDIVQFMQVIETFLSDDKPSDEE